MPRRRRLELRRHKHGSGPEACSFRATHRRPRRAGGESREAIGDRLTAERGLTLIGMLGVSWSKAQWLVAALGVGIGFGLQEIVANFISGLIMLFERPVRVGDTVTVGEVSGVVARIQIRATTIRGWDNKELLVPNREFITGRLLNWTLSDRVIRLTLVVGVAYKAGIDDLRESPALDILGLLDGRGARTAWYDPQVEALPSSLASEKVTEWTREALAGGCSMEKAKGSVLRRIAPLSVLISYL